MLWQHQRMNYQSIITIEPGKQPRASCSPLAPNVVKLAHDVLEESFAPPGDTPNRGRPTQRVIYSEVALITLNHEQSNYALFTSTWWWISRTANTIAVSFATTTKEACTSNL